MGYDGNLGFKDYPERIDDKAVRLPITIISLRACTFEMPTLAGILTKPPPRTAAANG